MIINTFQCDICKTQKKEVNHWWVAVKANVISFQPFNGSVENDKNNTHLCGIECAQKWLGQKMQEVM